MPKWRDFFSVDSGKVTISVQSLENFVSEKATELAAQLQQSRSDAESSLHDLKEDVCMDGSRLQGYFRFWL